MLKLSFRREREKEFRHISHGLIPAASVAPKPAVPRTPPPRSPDPSPERPRSALAAAILSSSLTGQTWALPPTYPRAFTESDPSESVNYEPTLFQRETWAEDVQSAEPSEGELDGRAALKEIHDEEHVYQTINTAGESETNEPVYALPVKPKATSQQLTGTSAHDPDFDRFNDAHEQAPKRSQESFRKELDRKSTRKKNKARSMEEIQAKNIVSRLSGENVPAGPSTPISTSASQIKAETSEDNKVKMDPAPSQRQRASAPEMIQRQSSFNPRDKKQDSISQAEVQSLRRQAQELVDENDALKMTVHRLNVELSRYQVRFRPLSKEEISKTEGLPVTDSAPPWLLDMKYLSPLLLAYEDRMKEKDALLKTTEEEMKRLRVHVEQVIKENDKLHEDISKMGGVTQTDWERLQEQAVLVLQENQLLIEQLDEESVKAKRTQSKHHSEVSKLAKQLMLCEAEKHHLEEELEASKREAQKNTRNAQTLQDRLKDAVTWEEHCNIAGKLKWYDSFTGVPVCQQNLSLEKASVLFNMAALYSQIGTRSDRQTLNGLDEAISSFQKAAGTLHYLKETFTHTPSYDMSPAMLSMLIRMMIAQAQEGIFEKIALPGVRNHFYALLKMSQEAAKVSEIYDHVHQYMIQTPIKDNVPLFWSTMAQVKTNHYQAVAHYFVSLALLEHQLGAQDDEDQQEKALSQVYDHIPDGRTPLDILKKKEERERIGKAHIRRAILCHEEALRVYSLSLHLNKLEILQDILKASLQRSLEKSSAHEEEEEFTDYMEAPDVIAKTEHKAEMEVPSTIKVKVMDFFQRLGPLSVFSAKQQWTAPRTVHICPEDRDVGFTLRGDPPVQVVSLDPLCNAAEGEHGLKEGDYIVAVGDTDCKWMGVGDVMRLLKDVGEEGVDIQVVSLMDINSSMPTKSATFCGNLPKTYSMICLAYDDADKNPKSHKVTKKSSFLSWGIKNKLKSTSTLSLPTADQSGALPWNKPCPSFPRTSSHNNDSLHN